MASQLPADPAKATAVRQELEKLLSGVENRGPGRTAREAKATRLDERIAEALLNTLDIETDVSGVEDGASEDSGYLSLRKAMDYARSRASRQLAVDSCEERFSVVTLSD